MTGLPWEWDTRHARPGRIVDRAMAEQDCPVCHAAAGQRCVGEHGVIIHGARAEAWREARKAKNP